jgi:DNA gyrase subunit A
MTASGVVIRIRVDEIRIIGRGTKGVRIIRLDKGDRVVGVALVPADEINGGGEPTVPPADEQENT